MAETTKRERSPSPQRESKRAKEEDQQNDVAHSKEGDKAAADTTTMSADASTTEEQVAVDIDATGNADDHAEPKASTSNASDSEAKNSADGQNDDVGEAAEGAEGGAGEQEVQPQNISMRALIVTGDASIIIGKQGKHINEIRDKSGAKLTISDSIPGNPERILIVSGQLDAVSKAFGLIVRRINDEPFDQASLPGSKAVTIRFIVPNSRMGSVIGKGGAKIKEIQEASGARLTAGEQMLPGSTEVSGRSKLSSRWQGSGC